MLPHPIAFGVAAIVSDDGTALGDFTPFLNQQVEGADHVAKIENFLTQCERWRLAYMGVSVHFDGPALSNQGSLTVSQAPFTPRQYYTGIQNTIEAVVHQLAVARVCTTDALPADLAQSSEFPNYDKAISMPNAYVGEIKEGAYIPLKLTKTCQQWMSRSDLQLWSNADEMYENGGFALPIAAHTLSFPFTGLPGFAVNPAAGASSGLDGATSPLCNDIVAHICGRNISTASALVFTFRVGFEVQVEPGTTLSPYQKLSPPYDPVALKAYFLVARQLKDAYPVSYNDLGKLWDVISGGLEFAAPILSILHPGLGGLASAVKSGGNAIRDMTRKKDGKGSITSAATLAARRTQVDKAVEAQFAKLAGKRAIPKKKPDYASFMRSLAPSKPTAAKRKRLVNAR